MKDLIETTQEFKCAFCGSPVKADQIQDDLCPDCHQVAYSDLIAGQNLQMGENNGI